MSLLLNMPSRLVITFLPRSKRLLISWLQSPSAVILELQKIKFVSTVSAKHGIIHRTFPHRGNYLAQNVSSAKVEKF